MFLQKQLASLVLQSSSGFYEKDPSFHNKRERNQHCFWMSQVPCGCRKFSKSNIRLDFVDTGFF